MVSAPGFTLARGGAIQIPAGGLTTNNTRFINNYSSNDGGAISFMGFGSNPARPTTAPSLVLSKGLLVVNTLFAGNSAAKLGQAVYISATTTANIIHTTVANPTVMNGAAIVVQAGMVNITNTLIASYTVGISNNAGTVNENFNLFSGVTTLYNGAIASGGNSLTGTAAFYDTNWYALTQASAAKNTGTDAGIYIDAFGDARPLSGGFDIGYDEVYTPGISLVANPISQEQNLPITLTATVTGSFSGPVAGQTVCFTNLQFDVVAVATNELSHTISTGIANLHFTLNPATRMLNYTGSFVSWLNPTYIYLMRGGASVNGISMTQLAYNHDGVIAGTLGPLSDADLIALLHGELYVNIETAAYPAGELRGQLLGAVCAPTDSNGQATALYSDDLVGGQTLYAYIGTVYASTTVAITPSSIRYVYLPLVTKAP
jgi:predicted outer membrane repeat protein